MSLRSFRKDLDVKPPWDWVGILAVVLLAPAFLWALYVALAGLTWMLEGW